MNSVFYWKNFILLKKMLLVSGISDFDGKGHLSAWMVPGIKHITSCLPRELLLSYLWVFLSEDSSGKEYQDHCWVGGFVTWENDGAHFHFIGKIAVIIIIFFFGGEGGRTTPGDAQGFLLLALCSEIISFFSLNLYSYFSLFCFVVIQ